MAFSKKDKWEDVQRNDEALAHHARRYERGFRDEIAIKSFQHVRFTEEQDRRKNFQILKGN